jgi:LysR family carnitine catabolism transcriptional activator
MNLTLRQVRAFIAVAELAHFTRAGERLGLSQSSVSTLVRELEDNLGLRLFDRHTRMLRLTQAGVEMLPLARKALADLDRAFSSSHDLRSLGRGRVKVAAASLQAALLMPRVIKDFCDEFPGIRIDVHDVTEYEVIEKLRAGDVDFGLGSALAMQDIVARPLTTDTFVAVMPAGHPLAQQPVVTWRELADVPLIGPPPGNAVREQLDLALARQGITLRRSHEVILPLTILGMVEGGLGIAVMTSAMSRLALALGLVTRDVAEPVIQREMSLLFHADRTLSPAAEAFSDRLRRHCREPQA